MSTGLRAQAAITWETATYISGDSDVSTVGTLLHAYNFTADSANATVNGVTFVGTSGDTADLTFTTTDPSAFNVNSSAFGSDATFYTSLSSDYQTLLRSSVYWDINGTFNPASPDVVTISNLVSGQTYRVQLWVNDSRLGYEDRVNGLSDGLGHETTIRFNNGSTASLGQSVAGTFTASGASQAIYFSPSSGNAIQLNAMTVSLSAVPEPSTYAALAGLGALGAAIWRRRRLG